jgi:hypothetical protein
MGRSKRSVRDEIEGLKPAGNLELAERRLAAKSAELNAAKADNKRLVQRNAELSAALERFAAIQEAKSTRRRPVRQSQKSDDHHAIGIINWSDWHVAEKVDKNKTHGRNKYNPEIAKQRARKLANNTLKMLAVLRTHVRVEELVVQLGGDFVTGYLHPELAETNCMGTMEEAYFAQELLEESLVALLSSAKAKRVRVICLRGNHGRTTKRMQFKNDYETSIESMIYWNLRDRLTGEGVEWDVPRSDVVYTTLQPGYDLRSIHGHQIKYRGGVGGIGIPLHKWIWKQDASHPAIMTALGHFHTFEPGRRYFICGSLKGWDEYALSLGFEYEPPSQSICLFDCRTKLMTARYPIFCE